MTGDRRRGRLDFGRGDLPLFEPEAGPTRNNLLIALKATGAVLAMQGGAQKHVSACDDLATLIEFENDPRFWADIFYLYAKAGEIPMRAAALMTLHAYVVAKEKSQIEAVHEGAEFRLEINEDGETPVPAWALAEVAKSVNDYLAGDLPNLNSAFRLAAGKKGVKTMMKPLHDLSTLEFVATSAFIAGEQGGKSSDARAIDVLTEWVESRNPAGAPASGYSEKTVKTALARARKILARYGFGRRGVD